METQGFAKFHRIVYDINVETGWYIRRPQAVHFAKMPGQLKVERTHVDRFRQQGAETIITGPVRDKRRTFYTGLRTLPVEGWHIGNDYEQRKGRKVLSLVLFRFSADHAELTVYYFNGFYRADIEDRTRYAVAFIHDQERQRPA